MTSENVDWVAEQAGDGERTNEIRRMALSPSERKSCHFQEHLAFLSTFKKNMNTGIVSFEEIQIQNNGE